MGLWDTREEAIHALDNDLVVEADVLAEGFNLLDVRVRELVTRSETDTYSEVLVLTLLKLRNFALAYYSVSLDGLTQEAGALLRPLVESYELLIYIRIFPDRVSEIIDGKLPPAGERAKKIDGKLKFLRDNLNEHAAHIGLTGESIRHLYDLERDEWRVVQPYRRGDLRDNMALLFAFLEQAIVEAFMCLSRVDAETKHSHAARC